MYKILWGIPLNLKSQIKANSVILGDFSTLISLIDKNKTELLFELSETWIKMVKQTFIEYSAKISKNILPS